jgi:dTDP-4-dehydrorhamnose reductase
VSKFTSAQRSLIKSIVASLTIKRIPEADIVKAIFDQTGKTISDRYLCIIKQQIQKESYHWYNSMRQSQYSYVHEFKERINEILDLQKKHHAIIDSPAEPTTVKQTSLAELHRLNITLSNYFAVAPTIVNDFTIPTIKTTSTDKTTTEIIV